MGTMIAKKPVQSGPVRISYNQAKQIVGETSNSLRKIKNQIKFQLQFNAETMVYDDRNWRKSNVYGLIEVKEKNNSSKSEAVTLDLEQVHKIRELLDKIIKSQHQDYTGNEGSTPTPTPTPSKNEQDRECCICYEEKASTVLPCTVRIWLWKHSFCAGCTTKYIIEQEEHKCPTCRTQFWGNKETIKRSFYQLIEEDRIVYEEIRSIILEYLMKNNRAALQALNLHNNK